MSLETGLRCRPAAGLLLLLLAGCDGSNGALFERLSQPLADMPCGREPAETILEVNGGGVALFDADGDEDQDLLLVAPGVYPVQGEAPGRANRLYRNDGGRFVDVTAGSGVDVPGWCNGVAVGDVDADGRRDLYITRLGTNVLLLNRGGMVFEEVPDAAGAAGAAEDWSTSATFVDIDRDGDLDLYVVNYLAFDPLRPPRDGVGGWSCKWLGLPVMCGPQGFAPQADRFYRNEGGRFVEATDAFGLAAAPSFGLGVIEGDWNLDGWPDIYVSNDSMPNFLFLSDGKGRLSERGVLHGAALSARGREQAGMGIAAGDTDGDGDEDLLVTNFSMESNAFYVNQGAGMFRDEADTVGLGGPSRALLGWGAAFLDADLDGDLDLITANGHVYPEADASNSGTSWAQPDVLYLQAPDRRWLPASWPGEEPAPSRALAVGDIDDDGVADLVITRLSRPPAVWRGTAGSGRSVQVRLQGPPGNPDALGATLLLRDALGTRFWRVRSCGGFQSAQDPRAIFAFRGPFTLEVRWPNGRVQEVSSTVAMRVSLKQEDS
ncbi:MAG: CRTAC1 family protein [Planctomycetota bacterium]